MPITGSLPKNCKRELLECYL